MALFPHTLEHIHLDDIPEADRMQALDTLVESKKSASTALAQVALHRSWESHDASLVDKANEGGIRYSEIKQTEGVFMMEQ